MPDLDLVTIYHDGLRRSSQVPRETAAGWADEGWRLVDEPAVEPAPVEPPVPPVPPVPVRPADKAPIDDWRAYAVSQGVDEQTAAGMSRRQLLAAFPADTEPAGLTIDGQSADEPTVPAGDITNPEGS